MSYTIKDHCRAGKTSAPTTKQSCKSETPRRDNHLRRPTRHQEQPRYCGTRQTDGVAVSVVPRKYNPPVFEPSGPYNTAISGAEFYLVLDGLGISFEGFAAATSNPVTSVKYWTRQDGIPIVAAIAVRDIQRITTGVIDAMRRKSFRSPIPVFRSHGYRQVFDWVLPESWWRMCIARAGEMGTLTNVNYQHG